MTSREVLNLKDNEEFYIVVLSNPYQLHNPFLRHYGAIKTTEYKKPLGIFKTKFKNKKIEHQYSWTNFDANLDTTEFEHLYWRGRFDKLPNGKQLSDYAQAYSDHISCIVYDDPYKVNPLEYLSQNMFFTKDEAKQYYDKMLKKFNKDMKTYITNLKSEITQANRNIENAQKQIDYYENIF